MNVKIATKIPENLAKTGTIHDVLQIISPNSSKKKAKFEPEKPSVNFRNLLKEKLKTTQNLDEKHILQHLPAQNFTDFAKKVAQKSDENPAQKIHENPKNDVKNLGDVKKLADENGLFLQRAKISTKSEISSRNVTQIPQNTALQHVISKSKKSQKNPAPDPKTPQKIPEKSLEIPKNFENSDNSKVQKMPENEPQNFTKIIENAAKNLEKNDEISEKNPVKNPAPDPKNRTEFLANLSRSEGAKTLAMKPDLTHFARDLQRAVENYKPPVTTLEIELNPKELGKITLNITKNKNDLRVQIFSNPAAISMFFDQQHALHQRLSDLGFGGVNLEFSHENPSQNSGQNQKNSPDPKMPQTAQDTEFESMEITATYA